MEFTLHKAESRGFSSLRFELLLNFVFHHKQLQKQELEKDKGISLVSVQIEVVNLRVRT